MVWKEEKGGSREDTGHRAPNESASYSADSENYPFGQLGT